MSSQRIVSVLGDLPTDVLIAGWFGRPIQDVPYLCARSIFISYELHQLFHKNYALEMRARALALIDAYYAHELSDITILRDRIGVTHLLLKRKHINKKRASYFAPYDRYISKRVRGSRIRLLLKNELLDAVIYEDEQYILLDLSRLP
ncbi:MAG: hypothetical protein JKX85_13990 [Phycisphaeraceae bacterium]|nr:hypothetical protein [Phycisphaeraceae bacterium]